MTHLGHGLDDEAVIAMDQSRERTRWHAILEECRPVLLDGCVPEDRAKQVDGDTSRATATKEAVPPRHR